MGASSFIAGKLRFNGHIVTVCVAVSFLVMIIAVSVSDGFRREIRSGVAGICGDIFLTSTSMNYLSEDDPICACPSYKSALDSVRGVVKVTPTVYRAGIVKCGENIHGVLFKGIPERSDSTSLSVSIPSRLSEILSLKEGDSFLTYFVGEKMKVRKFFVSDIYPSILDSNESLIVYASIDDMRRLNGWTSEDASALEVTLSDEFRSPRAMREKNSEIGYLTYERAGTGDDALVATSAVQKFPQLFDWLNLIDGNVFFILVLMTIVAGFNMISGLLIMLFRNISTIGILKSMGMTDRSISKVFLLVSSRLVAFGMVIGNALAFLFCWIQSSTHLLRLNPENYFVSFVPVCVNVPKVIVADAAAFAAIMLLLMMPCIFISRVDPARTVRSQ